MRGRRRGPDIWGDFYDQFRRPDDPARPRRGAPLPPEASGRLLDAAIGILGAVRTFVDVAEDVLQERRARLVDPARAERHVRSPRDGMRPPVTPQDDSGVVRDIPLTGA